MTPTLNPGAAALEPLPQHVAALNRANEVRLCQAALKERIRVGRLHVDAVLVRAADLSADEYDAIDRMTVMDLLRCPHRMGRARVRIMLDALSHRTPPVTLGEVKRVGSMTERQRYEVARELRRRVPSACSPRSQAL
jgi:hypothetical protein